MFQAMFFKEWLKIRWTLLIMLLLSVGVLINIWINLVHDLRFSNPSDFWGVIIFRKYVFYRLLQFFPLLAGLTIALAQFLPEIHRDRLKLTLRLPQTENWIMFQMSIVGFAALLALYLLDLIFLISLLSLYFPVEILVHVLTVTIPWFLAGLVAYFAVGTVLIEPVWPRRVVLALITYVFIQTFYQPPGIYSYARILPALVVLTLLSGLWMYYTVHRYQKGVA